MAETTDDKSNIAQELGDGEAKTVPTPIEVDCPSVVVSSTAANLNETSALVDSDSKMPGDGRGDGEGTSCPGKSAAASQRRMKKDDSGISVEKAHEEEGSSSEEEDESGSDIVMTGKGKGLSKLDVKKMEGLSDKSSPDSGHHESSFIPDYLECKDEAKSEPTTPKKAKTDKQKKRDKTDKAKKEFTTRWSPKDLESEELDSDDDEPESPVKEKKVPPPQDKERPKKAKPPHRWFLCPEVVSRQYGVGNRFQNDLFSIRANGSLHMVERLELMYKMQRHEGCVNTLHFNCSGTRLASGSDDLNVILWDWTVSNPVLVYDSGHRSNVFQAKFIPFSGDCHIVSCARDGQVRLAELSSTGICKGTRRLAQHRGPAHKLALQFDSPQSFLSCGEDAVVYEIDLRENKPEKLLTCKEEDRKVALYTIFVNPSNSYEFAIGGRDHKIRIYDKRKIVENDGTLKTFCPHHLLFSEIRANVTCLVYNYNGSEILATYNDEDIYSFDTSHSTEADYVHKYQGHRNNATVKGVNYFGSKSEYVVSGSDCGNIYVWERESEHVINYMAGDEGGVVNCLEPHPHLPVLATSGLDDDVKIWVPSCEHPPKLAGLKSITASNQKEREEERRREPETIDGQMLWYFMHHLRRTARRRARQEGQDVDESSSEGNSDDSDDSDDVPQSVQCAPS